MLSKCSRCNQPAVYFRKYTSEALCKSCLIKTTELRVRKTINKRKMLKEDDRIAVAISGGKDSAVLLDLLFRIEQKFPKVEIIPVSIDEGIRSYRNRALQAAQDLVNRYDLKLIIRSFKDLFGHSLDTIINLKKTNRIGACSYCGILRRRAINTVALEMDATVIATGHNLDDEAQTIIMNILRGDAQRIARTNRMRKISLPYFVPRVKPLMELPERDIVAYAHHLSLPYHDEPCPYAGEAYRNAVRQFLNEMELKHPGTLLAVVHTGDTIAEGLRTQNISFTICKNCGTPTTKQICKSCKLLADLI